MITKRLIRACLLVLPLSLSVFAGQKKAQPEEKTASVNMIVVRDSNGKPVTQKFPLIPRSS